MTGLTVSSEADGTLARSCRRFAQHVSSLCTRLAYGSQGVSERSLHTRLSPQRVTANSQHHSDEDAKECQSGLPFVETVVVLKDERECLKDFQRRSERT